MSGLSQGFECEIDREDWIICKSGKDDLTIMFISGDDQVGSIVIGAGQIQNLINFLECVKNSISQ